MSMIIVQKRKKRSNKYLINYKKKLTKEKIIYSNNQINIFIEKEVINIKDKQTYAEWIVSRAVGDKLTIGEFIDVLKIVNEIVLDSPLKDDCIFEHRENQECGVCE